MIIKTVIGQMCAGIGFILLHHGWMQDNSLELWLSAVLLWISALIFKEVSKGIK